MQKQTQTETRERPLAEQITAAQSECEKLRSGADDAAAEHKRWSTAFEHEPTIESRDNRDIWAQKAKNARAAADSYERDVLNRLTAQQRAEERNAIAAEVERQQSKAIARLHNAGELFLEAARELDAAIADFAPLHMARLEAGRAGAPLYPLSLSRELEAVNAKWADLRGRNDYEKHTTHAQIYLEGPNGSDAPVVVEFRRPMSAVPGTIR